MLYENKPAFAVTQDKSDPIAGLRREFMIPMAENKPVAYFCGHSLGLQPRQASIYINEALEDWGMLGVEGHFRARRPWYDYHSQVTEGLAAMVGAQLNEVVAMNTLTANLHLLMISFYRPTPQRYKIIIEPHAFPSDIYAVQSQAALHGYDPRDAIVILPTTNGYQTAPEVLDDLPAAIKEQAALVLLGGVNYFTGQLYDIEALTQQIHAMGAVAGFDLAHAIGNVVLQLHNWEVDFAVWCSYKYLNSGPGAVAGAFVHWKHGENFSGPRLAGWWGQQSDRRFLMEPVFEPTPGVEGWQLSNPPIFSLAPLVASLELFAAAGGITALRNKSIQLTGYLEYLTKDLKGVEILTPVEPARRGCQLSFRFKENGRSIFQQLQRQHIWCDWREPDVIRAAPVPLYNTFEDVYRLGNALQQLTQ
jgi:kynureninase